MQTKKVLLSQVKVNANNPRTITERKLRLLVERLLAFPKMITLRPVVVDERMTALGGNMRLRAFTQISHMTLDAIAETLAKTKNFQRLTKGEQERLLQVNTTQEAYDEVKSWYFFGRYAAFLFLEVYCNVFNPEWEDNVKYGWEPNENYTLGALSLTRSNEKSVLDNFLERARRDAGDNAFAIETSLCAIAKFAKGTRWNGYYTERMLDEARGTKYESIIYQLAR